MTDTILVTGATGKTGRRLVPQLLRRGAVVRAASRTRAGIPFDWTDPGTYAAARKGADAIYLVTDFPASGDPTDRVRELLDGADARRVVLLSALGAGEAPPDDPLRRVELAVESAGIPWTILRPGAFAQNFSEPHWMRLREGIRDRDEIVMPGGEGRVSWVSTVDIAAVAAAALTEEGHGGRGYTVVGPEPLTMPEVAARISAAAGRPIGYVESGRAAVRAGLVAAGYPGELVEPVSDLYVHALTSGAYGIGNDVVESVTGRPAESFAEYAAGAAAAWERRYT
ncbi:NmrA family protein [Virgisporangium aliadipatigenens]|uniref:NmrA family protein n=1 Tax=Virgisporangium aliadipatigenens TaxID=741659 RepID=A0A8J3YKK0_9ACTN|nr:NAD(P)H-binding protein [Virgisporangium aliadipatigenens]GIJ46012.1 NmrA family protein [Virgisporangium aliadipatigenens]